MTESPAMLKNTLKIRLLQPIVLVLMWFLPTPALSLGPSNYFTVALLEWPGFTAPNSDAFPTLNFEVQKQTSIDIFENPISVSPDSEQVFDFPFIALVGNKAFAPLPSEGISNLRKHLKFGGFLFIDDASAIGDLGFHNSIMRLTRRVFPTKALQKIPKNHTVYKSFFLIETPVGQHAQFDVLWGLDLDDRSTILYSRNNMTGAWNRSPESGYTQQVVPGGAMQRELSFRLGLNIVMYSLCLNYKRDQVHVKFILKKRRWRR